MSSHWSFFPLQNSTAESDATGLFLDVTNYNGTASDSFTFIPDTSSIGDPGTTFNDAIPVGNGIVDIGKDFDFYNVDHWEKSECGIFDPKYKMDIDENDDDDHNKNDIRKSRSKSKSNSKKAGKISEEVMEQYKNHMRIQLDSARRWRETVHKPLDVDNEELPPLVVCQSDKVPTLNQILRRKRKDYEEENDNLVLQTAAATLQKNKLPSSQWEYDYVSGRSVPGDGRLDFDKSFPPQNVPHKRVRLGFCLHAKQMCWASSKGSLDTIWKETVRQIKNYEDKKKETANTINEGKRGSHNTAGELNKGRSRKNRKLIKVLRRRKRNKELPSKNRRIVSRIIPFRKIRGGVRKILNEKSVVRPKDIAEEETLVSGGGNSRLRRYFKKKSSL